MKRSIFYLDLKNVNYELDSEMLVLFFNSLFADRIEFPQNMASKLELSVKQSSHTPHGIMIKV